MLKEILLDEDKEALLFLNNASNHNKTRRPVAHMVKLV
jgi:hypothetical protein